MTGLGPSLAVLLPKRGDSIVELAELGGEDDVMSLGQTVQEIGSLLACLLDLGTDFSQCSHIRKNDAGGATIPGWLMAALTVRRRGQDGFR
jgi:hypothetical protein